MAGQDAKIAATGDGIVDELNAGAVDRSVPDGADAHLDVAAGVVDVQPFDGDVVHRRAVVPVFDIDAGVLAVPFGRVDGHRRAGGGFEGDRSTGRARGLHVEAGIGARLDDDRVAGLDDVRGVLNRGKRTGSGTAVAVVAGRGDVIGARHQAVLKRLEGGLKVLVGLAGQRSVKPGSHR